MIWNRVAYADSPLAAEETKTAINLFCGRTTVNSVVRDLLGHVSDHDPDVDATTTQMEFCA
jgi:hypothetical protein